MIEVAIIDDDDGLRRTIKRLLNNSENFRCRIDAGNLGSFFEIYSAGFQIDVLLLDVELEDKNSLDYLESFRRLLPQTKILVFTGFQDPGFLLCAMRDGADGYLMKGGPPKKLLETIQVTYDGGAYIEPNIAAQALPIFRRMMKPINDVSESWHTVLNEHGLSERETQVALGILEGKSYKEIASQNNLSLNTIRHYIKILYKKLEINTKLQLAQKLKSMV